MVEQGDRAIGIAIDAGIDHVAVFLQFVALEHLLEREQAIAFGGVEQLGADPLDPAAAAPRDQGKVEVLVAAFPVRGFGLTRLSPVGARQMMERQDEILFPFPVEALDRLTDRQAIDPAARLYQFLQFLGTHRRHPKALLLLERDEPFGKKPVERLANRAARRVEPFADGRGADLLARAHPTAENVGAQLHVDRLGQGRRLPLAGPLGCGGGVRGGSSRIVFQVHFDHRALLERSREVARRTDRDAARESRIVNWQPCRKPAVRGQVAPGGGQAAEGTFRWALPVRLRRP